MLRPFILIVFSLLLGGSLLAQVDLKQEFQITPMLSGETLAGSQLFDANGDGQQDVILSYFNASTSHWRLLAYSTTGALLQSVEGTMLQGENSWKGRLARQGGQMYLFSASTGALQQDKTSYLDLRAHSYPALLLLDSLHFVHSADSEMVRSIEAVSSGSSLTLYAGSMVHKKVVINEVYGYYLFAHYSVLAAASFEGGRFTAADTVTDAGDEIVTEIPGRIFTTGFHEAGASGSAGYLPKTTRTIIELAPSFPLSATIRRTFLHETQPKGVRFGTTVLKPFFGSAPRGEPSPMLFYSMEEQLAYPTGSRVESFHGPDPTTLADIWTERTTQTGLYYPLTLKTSHLGAYATAQDTLPGMSTTVLLTYAVISPNAVTTPVLRAFSTRNGKVLLTQPVAVTPVAALSDGSGLHYFLAQDGSLIRLFSLKHVALETAPTEAPQLISPANGGYAPTDTITLTWRTVARARAYRLHIQAGSYLDTLLMDTTFSFIGSRLSQYSWSVVATNTAGEAGSETFTFGITPWPPTPPTLLTVQGSVWRLPLVLSYVKESFGEPGRAIFIGFHLQVSGDSTFSPGTCIVNDSVRPRLYGYAYDTLYYLPPRERYFWRVGATSPSGTAWSAASWFHIVPDSTRQVNFTETFDRLLPDSTRAVEKLSWTSVVGTAACRVLVKGREGQTLVDTILTGDVTSYMFTGKKGETYKWQLALEKTTLWTWMDPREFLIDPPGDPPAKPETFALEQNYPNPFNPVTTIKYTIGGNGAWGMEDGAGAGSREPGVSRTRLVVYDLLGRQVATLVDEEKAPGSYEVTFDATGLSSGVYLYRFQAGSFTETKKLVVLK